MYFILNERFVFSGLSRNRCTNNLFVLKSSFLYQSLYFALWLGLQAVLSSSKRQILVLGDVRWIQEKEVIVINQAYFV